MILMNPLNHRTIDIIEPRQSKALHHYFLLHYSFKARCAVKIVVDHFHVVV